jgi:hypothetical protein
VGKAPHKGSRPWDVTERPIPGDEFYDAHTGRHIKRCRLCKFEGFACLHDYAYCPRFLERFEEWKKAQRANGNVNSTQGQGNGNSQPQGSTGSQSSGRKGGRGKNPPEPELGSRDPWGADSANQNLPPEFEFGDEEGTLMVMGPRLAEPASCQKRLEVPVLLEMSDGTTFPIMALVDTGAEINLLGKSLIPHRYWRTSTRPRSFVTADQSRMAGGTLEITCGVIFEGVEMDQGRKKRVTCPITFWDARMSVECILSYAWLARHNIDVRCRRHGLLIFTGPSAQGEIVWVPGEVLSPRAASFTHNDFVGVRQVGHQVEEEPQGPSPPTPSDGRSSTRSCAISV